MACSAHLLSQSLYSSHRASPAGPRNLRSQRRPPQAARLGSRARGCRGVSLRVAASFEQGRRQVEIHLDKKVPTGAGLGGGSSNAATALWAANQFAGCIASEKDLQEWSGEIGSDIPFFFSRGAAYCTGRGEIVQDIPNPLPEKLPMVLIKPPEACSTAEVYKRLRLEQTSQADPLTLLKEITRNGMSQDVCVNDLEPPAFEVLPSLKRLKKRIIAASRDDYSAVFMSGSGSTIVGIGSPDPPAFVCDDEDYKDVFVSEACLLTRDENDWYREPIRSNATSSKEGLQASVADY